MIELPEGINLARQINETLVGKTVTDVFMPDKLNKFTFVTKDATETYKPLLTGRKILSATAAGMFVDIHMSDDTTITVGDGTILKYGDKSAKIPAKYQMLLVFDDETFLAFTVAMYGAIFAFKGQHDNMYHRMSLEKVSPLTDEFDEAYFMNLIAKETKNISVKALLATEQRIPGLGNGVLQDILFRAKVNPKRKINTLTEEEKKNIFQSIKTTLRKMTDEGGRDVQSDIFGNKGGYKTLLSASTYKSPCPVCGSNIIKEPYMGGAVYYCPTCQPL